MNGMAGKYHRTYLDEAKQAAFEKMQEETKLAANAYIAEAVREKLQRDGYLAAPRNLRAEAEALAAQAQEERTRRPRRRRGVVNTIIE